MDRRKVGAVGLAVLAIFLMVGSVAALHYTTVKPGAIAGEDYEYRDVNYFFASGGFSAYAMGQWEVPPEYTLTLVLWDHQARSWGDGLLWRVERWESVYEVGTRVYGTVGTYGDWIVALVPAPVG
ncbi:hypothetical protein TON_1033 [Thermococcus onnurineus NA1]|uniref:Uncharacterized protein n=1 Tax=Thermococcus onnurineus (strain NA1) TaxID=523850 RepID=B6YWQ8_THEON|nr:hypothetical protein [Thermococcus onnurineus]ACJ16521.1 hypothetical protein TON_1033 [Thermococcus onnurineus NA1]